MQRSALQPLRTDHKPWLTGDRKAYLTVTTDPEAGGGAGVDAHREGGGLDDGQGGRPAPV